MALQNSETYEKYLKAKQRKTNRARKNETKNVVVQCKAEDVEGYEGQKTIDDLLESLGEAAPQAQAQEDKKQKQKRASKDKREKKRRGGDKTASTSAAGNHHKDEDEEAADEEDNVDEEEDEITRIREAKGKKKKGGGSKAVTENSGIEFTNQNNVYMVSADDNLSRSENLAASSDSLNFVPVTGKKKGKKLKDEQEKMRDYNNKGNQDPGRGFPASGSGRDARLSQTRDVKQVPDNRRTSNYSLRSREVQISPEPEKEVSGNYELEQIPAFDAIQDFPALPSVSMTDNQHNDIHSAWIRKPSSGSVSSTTPPTNNNTNTSTVAVKTTTSAHNNPEQQQQPCDKLSVNQSNTNTTTPHLPAGANAANTNNDDVFKAAVNDSSSIDAAKNIERSQESDPSPNSGNSNNNDNNNISELTCDKSIVSDELSTATAAGDKDTNNHNDMNEQRVSIVASDICFVENVVSPSFIEIPQPTIAQSVATSTNPLLSDDNIEVTGPTAANIQGIDIAAGQYHNKDNVTGDQATTLRSGEDTSNDDNGHKLGEFHFDTRADAVLRAGGEAAISFTQDEEGEISFGFDINYQLIDDSLNAEQLTQPNPEEGRVDDYEGEGGAVVNAADGLDPTNIASVDKAIVSFSTAEGVLVGGGYHFMNNIHPAFASNDMPLRSQVDVSGTPCADPRQGEPKEVEVVSPESGICSPLSWQGEEVGNATASPPIQPGSYPRRPEQENRDLMCELKKLKYRGSSRSPSPHHSVRSGSAGSFTQGAEDISYTTGAADISYTQGASDISYTHGAADISFPRSEDSGLNTTRNQMEQLISAPSPNHTEIVSFLQNNWEEFSKDKKKVKVYGEKKDQQRR